MEKVNVQNQTDFDVLIVGAGISGIGEAYHLQQQCPDKSYCILEMKDTFGGTWETHKYPGIRSDSDLYTFGYRFKPWTGVPIASAEAILTYMGEVIEENNIGQHIRYGHRITQCSWSSADNKWTVTAKRKTDDSEVTFTCNFLWMCQGYYDHHENPNIPNWPNMEQYQGMLVHAQLWDPKTDYAGKKWWLLVPALQPRQSSLSSRRKPNTSPCYNAPRPIFSAARTATNWLTACVK